MLKAAPSLRRLLAILTIGCATLMAFGSTYAASHQQTGNEALEKELQAQYAAIEKLMAAPPPLIMSPSVDEWKVELRKWQAELASQFGKAADIVEEILKTNPLQKEMWRERLETLRLYAQPISSPDERTIYGAREVEKRAHIRQAPAPARADAASAPKVTGDVRLRMVLASDGTVKYIFPIKSLDGATAAAVEAARQIKFEPAVRNGQPASQFVTLVYAFKNGRSSKPYIPKTEF